MKFSPALLVLVVLGTVNGCGGGDDPPTAVSIRDACGVGDGTSVVVEGYLRLPETLRISDTAVIDLFAATGGRGTPVEVEFPIGDGPNQLRDIPAKFSVTSLRVQTAAGETVTIIDRVAVTAKVEAGDAGCVLTDPQVALAAG
jgi:hypothetical protein